MGKNLVSFFDLQCRDPNADNSHVSFLTTATIIKDPNAGSSRVSSTTATIDRDQNAGSSHVA